MTTENADHEARESGARIEELPASDMQLASEEREKPSPVRAPPGEPDEPEAGRRSSPPPPEVMPAGRHSPTPGDPDPEE